MGFFRAPSIKYGQILTLHPDAPLPDGFTPDLDVDVTSHSTSKGLQLSPFKLGPVPLDDGTTALNLENLWQFSGVYEEHWDSVNECPLPEWYAWRDAGYANPLPHRYPMGKGVRPVCTWWDGEALDSFQTRQHLHTPTYIDSAKETGAWRWLLRELKRGKRVVLRDFDTFDTVAEGITLEAALADPNRKVGHGMILAAELERCLQSLHQTEQSIAA